MDNSSYIVNQPGIHQIPERKAFSFFLLLQGYFKVSFETFLGFFFSVGDGNTSIASIGVIFFYTPSIILNPS